MVLVDTSIWIQLFRKRQTSFGELIWALTAKNEAAICGQIWVEFIGGFRKNEMRERFEKYFQAFPFVETSFQAFKLAANLLAKYPNLGSGDAIIAATSISYSSPLMTLDKDFTKLTGEGLTLVTASWL